SRELLDKVLADPNILGQSARVVVNLAFGKPNGLKLYAIRPGSIYARIGLLNEDSVQSINGYDISSPDRALEAYTKLRPANHLTVITTRRGQTQTLDYEIR